MTQADAALRAELAAVRAQMADVIAFVRDLAEEQRYLVRRQLAPVDRQDLAALLPLAHAAFGSGLWTAADLAAAALGPGGADTRALQELIGRFATEAGGLRRFGNFLERCAGATACGFRLVEVTRERDGVVWCAAPVRLSAPSKVAAPLSPAPGGGDH